jgi:methionyl aminopeptidase
MATTLIKTPEEINKMRVAGKCAAEVLEMIAPHVRPGVSTNILNDLCHRYIVENQAGIPAPLHYRGFPKSICTSINHQVCHGIPSDRCLQKGDIVNIDVTVIKDGYHGDTSQMFIVGKPIRLAQHLVSVTQACLYEGIRVVKPGAYLGDIGAVIQRYAESHGFSIVTDYCGHGIGRRFHEEPAVMHVGIAGTGLVLQPGMTFTIEPMLNAGHAAVKCLADGWTVVTKDHSLSAQWEHTVLVTETGVAVLTQRAGEVILLNNPY